MRRKVLALRHFPTDHLGFIGDSLAWQGIACEYADLYRGDARPDIAGAAALIVMGGPISANDDLPFLRQELDLIGEALALGKPAMGLCLGAQLIAKALGARVYANAVKEIGWYPVYWTGASARDPLHAGLAGPETVFHWHSETFDLPCGAELLAYSDACLHQAYRVRENIYGFQFHPEVTPQMIADWCAQDAECGGEREMISPIDPYCNAGRRKELAGLIFGRWGRLICG